MKKMKWVAVSVLGVGFSAFASSPSEPAMKEEKPGLLSQAKVTPKAAREIATTRVEGRVQSEELEEEHGKLVYSFDIKAPHTSGIEEIQVNALTGEIVSVEHEGPKAEMREKQADKSANSPTK